MQIKPYEAALVAGSTGLAIEGPGSLRAPHSLRATDLAQLTEKAQAAQGDSISLSPAVRELANALREALPTLDAARIAELLTPRDRFVLVRALDIVRGEQVDPREVTRLILDLTAYRLEERNDALTRGPRLVEARGSERAEDGVLDDSHVPGARAQTQGADSARKPTLTPYAARLALPALSARDEALARAILTSHALRDTLVDHAFVRALIDPDRTPTHNVDFSFLRRLVVSLSPAHSEGANDPTVSLARRGTRASLADALTALDLSTDELPSASAAQRAQGRALLKERLATLPASETASARKPLMLQLRAADRTLLGLLYVAAEARRIDLTIVDKIATALIALRQSEHADIESIERVVPRTVRPEPVPSAESNVVGPDTTVAHAFPTPAASATLASAKPPRPLSETALPAARKAESGEEPAPLPARSFGSPSQIAAKASGSYGSLAPPPPAYGGRATLPPELGLDARLPAAAERLEGAATTAQTVSGTFVRALDLSQALGLGALLAEGRKQPRRIARSKLSSKHEAAIHAVTAPRETASEAEADDPLLEQSRQWRRRVRWQLLIQRRKRTRKHRM